MPTALVSQCGKSRERLPMSNLTARLLAGVAVLTVLAPAAHAQDADPPTQVVVTVTRQALPVDRIGQSVDVLADADIKSYQSLFVADLLEHTTDLSIVRNGGPGEAASASLRGAGADHTLYLIDGIALNDPSKVGGGADLGNLTTDDASRIEVLRGPLSTLWGSGAVGGVVSITTRQATRPLEGDLSLEGFDRYGSARLGLEGKTGSLNWRVFASGTNDQGVSAYDKGTEKDGFTQSHLGANLSYAVNDATTIRLLSLKSHDWNAFDGYPAPDYNFADTGDFGKVDTWLNALGLTNRFGKGEQTLSLLATETRSGDYNPDDTPNFLARGRIDAADYHVLYNFTPTDRLLAGARYERDDMRESTPSSYDPNPTPLSKATTLSSVYGQYSHDFGAASVAVSARHDDASSFGGQDIAQASLVVPAGEHVRFHASAGQGVKVPSLYQLYSDYGTSTLQPEKALSLDGGVDLTYGRTTLSATAFTRTVHDLIGFAYDGCTAAQVYGCYQNVDRSKASGLELEYRQDLTASLQLRGNYSLLSTRNESAGLAGLRLARTPDDMGSIDLMWTVTPRLQLGGGVRYVGKSFDDTDNTTVLKAYTLVNLRTEYALNDKVSLYGRIENAGDTRYETAAGYGQLRRRVWLGIHTRLF
jgi:vitamin B12 transporter